METFDRKGVISFSLLALGLAWLVALPLWLSGGLASPLFLPVSIAMMWTPTLAAWIVHRWISPLPEGFRRSTGVQLGKRWGWYWLFAWLVFPLLSLIAPLLGAALGLIQLDLSNFSGYRELIAQLPNSAQILAQVPIQTLVYSQFAAMLIAPVLNAPAALGEEWGWRGYLLPKLLPLGAWPAMLISGVIWGVWHAPLLLLGYNYPSNPVLGVVMMIGFCTVMGMLLNWTRLATGSIWPATLGHAAINGSAGVTMLLINAGQTVDTIHVGLLGWSGWIAPLLLIGALVALKRLPLPPEPAAQAPQVQAVTAQ